MSKKKKGKVVQFPQSLEGKIRTRARKLEIGKCYISEDWKLMREGNILITRKHTNGNLTFGFFLVDLGVLGVKDTFCEFNFPEHKLLSSLENSAQEDNFIEVEYNLAHNIIYGVVEYAEDHGFKPCKNFDVSQYVLEKDDEKIPLIDIEFGVNGLPAIFCNDNNPMEQEINQLEKTVGISNFRVINTDDINDDENLHDDIIEKLMPGWEDDIDELGVPDWEEEQWVDFFNQNPKDYSFRVLQYFVDIVFIETNNLENLNAFQIVLGGAKFSDFYDKEEVSSDEMEAIEDIFKKYDLKKDHNKVFELITKQYPYSPQINLIVFDFAIDYLTPIETMQKLEDLKQQFPGNISILNVYSGWLIDNDKVEKIPELFNNKFSLKEFDPEKEFTENEVIQFCTTYCNYFIALNNLCGAEPYYQVLDTLDDDNPITKIILQNHVLTKMYSLKTE